MSELEKTLSNFYPKEEVDRIISDLRDLPEENQKQEAELIVGFLRKSGGEIPAIL